MIKGKGKAGYLTGSIHVPLATAATYGVWEAENSTIMALLINSMEPRIGRTYLFYKTSKEIWDSMQEMYSDLENSSQWFEIRSTIRSTKQGTLGVTEYFNTLVELWHEMDLFHTISWESLANSIKYNKMVEKDWIFDFLYGLNTDLDEVKRNDFQFKALISPKRGLCKGQKRRK